MIKESVVSQPVVTPEEVVEAYRNTGLTPCSGISYSSYEGGHIGCALGAMYLNEGSETPDRKEAMPLIYTFAENLFGERFLDFAVGFDMGYKDQNRLNETELYNLGYDCGTRVREEFGD